MITHFSEMLSLFFARKDYHPSFYQPEVVKIASNDSIIKTLNIIDSHKEEHPYNLRLVENETSLFQQMNTTH